MKRKLYASVLTLALVGQLASPVFATDRILMSTLDPDLVIDTSGNTELSGDITADSENNSTADEENNGTADEENNGTAAEDDFVDGFEFPEEEFPEEEFPEEEFPEFELPEEEFPEKNPDLDYWSDVAVAVAPENNVYTISSPEQLAWVASAVSSSQTFDGMTIKLEEDIDLEDKEWTPIGSYFSGTFDGGGHTIHNMTITEGGYNSQFGLFSSLSSSGTVQNLNITGEISVTLSHGTHSFVGGVAGSSSGVVENCHSNVNITQIQTATTMYGYCSVISGGIVGENSSGEVRNCSNLGSISSSGGLHAEAGGIVGVNRGSGKVYNCRNLGTISASLGQTLSHAGGIVGRVGVEDGLGSSSALVENCYNLSTSISGDPQGGVAGYCGNGVTVTHSYSIAQGLDPVGSSEDVQNHTAHFDSLGMLEPSITLGDEYYDTLLGALNAWVSLKDDDLYRFWQEGTDDMPTLGEEGWEPDPAPDPEEPEIEEPEFNTVISDVSGLEDFRLRVLSGESFLGETVGLTGDIALTSSWQGIGTLDAPFQGTFDGGGYTISSLSMDNDLSHQGFFGVVDGATIQNLTVSGSVSGGDYVGGLVGLAINSEIVHCNNRGTITGSYAVGGLVGQLRTTEGQTSSVIHSTNTGAVSSEGDHPVVGGVVGWSYTSNGTSLISKSYNTGAIEANGNNVGGIVGYHSVSHGGTGKVEHCYNTGALLGNDNVGGILGDSYDMGGTISLATCYNTGLIRGESHVGGIVGFQYQTTGTATVTQTVSLGNILGEDHAHRVVGSSTEAISGNYASSSVTVDGVTVTGDSDSLHGADTPHIDMNLWETAGFTQNNGWEFTTSNGIPTLIAFTPFS